MSDDIEALHADAPVMSVTPLASDPGHAAEVATSTTAQIALATHPKIEHEHDGPGTPGSRGLVDIKA